MHVVGSVCEKFMAHVPWLSMGIAGLESGLDRVTVSECEWRLCPVTVPGQGLGCKGGLRHGLSKRRYLLQLPSGAPASPYHPTPTN